MFLFAAPDTARRGRAMIPFRTRPGKPQETDH